MVKNLNTLERSLQVRVGKFQADEQSLNSVVINASEIPVVASNAGIYISPMRTAGEAEGPEANVVGYNQATKELYDTGMTSQVQQDLANVCEQGATTSTTVSFTNATTGFTTAAKVGVANVSPVNTLDVGANVSVSETGSNVLFVRGNTFIDGDLTTSGTVTSVKSVNLEVSDPIIEIGKNNTDANFLFDAGMVLNRPAGGNVTMVYREDADEFAIGYTANNASERFIVPRGGDGSNLAVHVYGTVEANTYLGSAEFMSGISNIAVLESNVSALNQNIASNLAVARTDLQSNVVLLRADIDSNLAVARTDLQSNVALVRTDIDSNLAVARADLRADLQSNVTILNQNIASNVDQANVYARADLQSNVSILETRLNDNSFRISTNATDLAETRGWVASNATTLNQNIASNLTTIRGDLQSNVTLLRTDIDSNLAVARTDIQSNLAVARTDLQSNVVILNANIESNLTVARTDLQDNVSTLNTTISALTLQNVSDVANTVSNCIQFTNTGASLTTDGRVGVKTDTPDYDLHVAGEIYSESNVLASKIFCAGTVLGNTAAQGGSDIVNKLTGNTTIQGNLHVIGTLSEFVVTNKDLKDPILGLGVGLSGVSDVGIIGEQDGATNSNIACGFEASSKKFIIGYTDNATSATTLNADSGQEMNVSVVGSLTAATSITASSFLGDGTTLTGVATSTQLTALNDEVDSNAARTGVLETGLTAAIVEIDSNAARTSVLETDLTAAIAEIDSNAARVGVLETDLTQAIVEIDSNAVRTGTLETNLTQAIVEIDSNAVRTGTLETNLTQAIVEIDSNAARTSVLETDLTQAIVEIDSNAARVGTLETTYAPLANPTFTSGITVTTTVAAAAVTVSDLTPGRVVFVDTGDTLADDPDMTWTKSAGGVAGKLEIDGDIVAKGNVTVQGTYANVSVTNTLIEDAIIEIGDGNSSDTLDLGIIMTRPTSNVVVGYRGDEAELMIGHTLSDPSSVHIVPDTSRDLHVHAYGNLEVGSSANVFIDHTCGDVTMTHTDDGSVAGPVLTLHRVSASAADGDYMGQLKFTGKNDTGGTKTYAKMTAKISDASNSTEDGLFERAVHKDGSVTIVERLTPTALKLINGTGLEVDDTATFSGAVTGINVATGNCVVANRCVAATFHGSGQALTNLPTTLQSASVAGASSDRTITLTHATTGLSVSSNISCSGKFLGDGSELTGLSSTLQAVTTNGASSDQKLTLANATGIQASGNVLCANLTSSNVVYAAEGLVTNTSTIGPTIKRYCYSGSMANSNVAMVFSTHTFYAKITAQLIHSTEDISTFVFEISGGKNASSGTSSKDIALGRVNKFGHANSYNWHSEIDVSPTELVIKPQQAALGGGSYSYDLCIEHMSSHAGGKLVKIMENQVDQHSFAY